MAKDKIIVPGGIHEYIAKFPEEIQVKLKEMKAAIDEVSPGAIETVSYFQIPGYSYPGYDYNGMFAWFSVSKQYIRLHVRPPIVDNYKNELKNFVTTEAIVSFPANEKLPIELIKKMVKSSIQVMKEKKLHKFFSMVFCCTAAGAVNKTLGSRLIYFGHEAEIGFEAIWVPYQEAIRLLKKNEATTLEGSEYISPRDLAFLEAASDFADSALSIDDYALTT